MGVALYYVRGVLGASFVGQTDPTRLTWFFVDKKHKMVWSLAPLHIFWAVWKAKNKMTFNDDMFSIWRLKSFFVYFLWSENKVVYR